MPIYKSTYFPESTLAHQLLDGMEGLEVGGALHNAFGLNTVNVDLYPQLDTVYKNAERELSRTKEVMPVDICAPGDKIPVPDKSFDFVISSHVIEHFHDPIAALKEWARIARKYIYIIVPQPDALPSDKGKLITPLDTLFARHRGEIENPGTDEHHTRWTLGTFVEMCAALGFYVSHTQDPDDKVGNGFCVVIDLQPQGLYRLTSSDANRFGRDLAKEFSDSAPFDKPSKKRKK